MKAIEFTKWLRCYLDANQDDTFTPAQFAEIYREVIKVDRLHQETFFTDIFDIEADKLAKRSYRYAGGQLHGTDYQHLLPEGYDPLYDFDPSSPMPITHAFRGYTAPLAKLIDERAIEEAEKDALQKTISQGIPLSKPLPTDTFKIRKRDPKF